MQRTHMKGVNRLISWRATFQDSTARLRRPKVTAILCQHCNTWVKSRRYDPLLYVCKGCAPKAAHDYYRARRAAADLAAEISAANQRAWDKELRQWRRHAARAIHDANSVTANRLRQDVTSAA